MYYCSGSQVCTGIQNIQITPACSCSQNTLTVNLSSGISAGTVIFTVDSIRNPFSTASVSGFSLTTGATLGVIEKSDNINVSVIVSIPKELTVDPIIIASPTTINEETAYTLSFSCSNPIPLGAIIIVDFPSDLTVNESITSAVQRIFGLSSAISYSVSGNSITLANGFTSYLLENSSIIFSVVNVLNPSSTKPTSVIKISLNTSSGSLVCAAGDNPALKVTATAGSLNNVSIVPEVATINAKTIYSFSFESADPLPIGAGIKITLPPDMSVEESARKKCVYIFPTSVLSQNSQCQSGGSSYIYLTQGFTTGYSSGIISFQIENVINPMTPAITDSIVIETYTDSSFEYLIGTDSSLSIQASSGSLSSVMILPKTLVTGEDVNYMFIIFTSNTIPIKGHIFIQFPPEIVILKLNAKCLNLSGFESTFTCTLTGSSITITRGFETGSFSPGSLSFSVDSVMNPSTTKTSSSFKIYTYSYGYIIDSMITGLTITSETPHPLISASISSSSSFVGEYADFTFSMTPFNPFYNNGAIIITSPSEITFPQAPNCVVGTVISSITCSLLDDRTLKAAVTLNSDYTGSNFHFVVKNIQNPKTTRETSSFTLTTMIDNYLIDSSSSEITVQATNPSQLSQLSIIPTASGINEITTYKVTLLNTYTIPLGGYISIILPPEIIIASTMKCKYADSYINCQNMGSNTIHLYLFPNDFNSALLNFQIENLIN